MREARPRRPALDAPLSFLATTTVEGFERFERGPAHLAESRGPAPIPLGSRLRLLPKPSRIPTYRA